MKAPEYRTEVVAILNSRGGKAVIHRTSCRYAQAAYYNGRLRQVRTGDVNHRIYRTCGVCLKGLSTFRLPADLVVEPTPVPVDLGWLITIPEVPAGEAASVAAEARQIIDLAVEALRARGIVASVSRA